MLTIWRLFEGDLYRGRLLGLCIQWCVLPLSWTMLIKALLTASVKSSCGERKQQRSLRCLLSSPLPDTRWDEGVGGVPSHVQARSGPAVGWQSGSEIAKGSGYRGRSNAACIVGICDSKIMWKSSRRSERNKRQSEGKRGYDNSCLSKHKQQNSSVLDLSSLWWAVDRESGSCYFGINKLVSQSSGRDIVSVMELLGLAPGVSSLKHLHKCASHWTPVHFNWP